METALKGVTLDELQKFIMTLSVVHDQGKTAFNLTKARFQGDSMSNPLSALYARADQLPEPVSIWVKQIADNTSFILINERKFTYNTNKFSNF